MGHGPRVLCPFLYPCLAASVNQELPQFCRTRSSAEALRSNDGVSAEGHFNPVSKAMYLDKKKAKVESSSDVSPDKLSHLPPEIKVTILAKLSVLDATPSVSGYKSF
uniref:F-box domain-containing protein n=1 Tax=Oryza meridionalis TaxID=40149 RepID=A0A0E0CLL0_9ORYZ